MWFGIFPCCCTISIYWVLENCNRQGVGPWVRLNKKVKDGIDFGIARPIINWWRGSHWWRIERKRDSKALRKLIKCIEFNALEGPFPFTRQEPVFSVENDGKWILKACETKSPLIWSFIGRFMQLCPFGHHLQLSLGWLFFFCRTAENQVLFDSFRQRMRCPRP